MKKVLLIALTLGLAVALAAPALAIDWSARGAITVKAAYYKNVDMTLPVPAGPVSVPTIPWFDYRFWRQGEPVYFHPLLAGTIGTFGGVPNNGEPDMNTDNAWIQLRTVLFIYARASENLQGVFGFEIDSTRWGDAGTTPPLGGSGLAGAWNTDQVAVEVKNAYIDFKIPKIPVRMKVGILSFQVRPHMLLLADGAGVSATIPLNFDPITLTFSPFWAKPWEATDHTSADDHDTFGIDFSIGMGNIKGGVFYVYQARRQLYDGLVPDPDSVPANPLYAEGDEMKWWVGPYIDAKFGPVAATFDFIYNGGEADFQGISGQADINYEGMVVRGEITYVLNKFKFGIGGLYGTGDDRDTRDYEGYTVPRNSEAAALNRDFLILCGDWGLFAPYGTNNVFGLFKPRSNVGGGVWYVRGFVDYQVLGWLKLMANVGYIGDTMSGTDNSFDPAPPAAIGGDVFGTDTDDDDSIGWELDVGAQMNIYKNLYLNSAFGYLIGGKALAGQQNGWRTQDPWAWVTTLTYFF